MMHFYLTCSENEITAYLSIINKANRPLKLKREVKVSSKLYNGCSTLETEKHALQEKQDGL